MLSEFPVYQSARLVIDLWIGIPESVARELSKRGDKARSTTNEDFVLATYDGLARSIGLKMIEVTDPDRTELPGAEVIAPGGAALEVWRFVDWYKFLEEDSTGNLRLTSRGADFQSAEDALIRKIDKEEGILELLEVLNEMDGSASTSELRRSWAQRVSPPLEKPDQYYRHRWRNIVARRLVDVPKRGIVEITESGRAYVR